MIFIFGSTNLDLVTLVPHIVAPGETVLAQGYETHCGGKGANQAVAASRARLDQTYPVVFAGAVGADEFGKRCIDNLIAAGVDTSATQLAPHPTGIALVSVDANAENAITVASGANGHLRADLVPNDIVSAAKVAMFQMEVPIAECVAMARRLPPDCTIIVNFAPASSLVDQPMIDELLSLTDILIVNEIEVEVIAELYGKASSSLDDLAKTLQLNLICTRGGDGVDSYRQDGSHRHHAAPNITVVDTTGAGDTFVGTLGAGIRDGLELDAAISRATEAASLACTKFGAQNDVSNIHS